MCLVKRMRAPCPMVGDFLGGLRLSILRIKNSALGISCAPESCSCRRRGHLYASQKQNSPNCTAN